MLSSGLCADAAVDNKQATNRAAEIIIARARVWGCRPRRARSPTASVAAPMSSAHAAACNASPGYWRHAAADRVGKMQHPIDQLEALPAVLGETIELG